MAAPLFYARPSKAKHSWVKPCRSFAEAARAARKMADRLDERVEVADSSGNVIRVFF